MNSLASSTDERNVKATNPWLVTVLRFAQRIDFFKPFNRFSLPMKEVNYTVLQKIQTLIASIAVGCQYTCEINEALVPDTAAANLIGLPQFPEQSQINRFLTRCTADNVAQLKAIHQELFCEHHLHQSEGKQIMVDIDQSGLIAGGKTYELANKGYFPRRRGMKGYQLSAAFAGQTGQALSFYLDPGNTHCNDRFADLVADVAACFKDYRQDLIIRADSGYGTAENIETMQSLGMRFIVKGCSSRQARNLAAQVKSEQWLEINRQVQVAELKSGTSGLRVIACETLTPAGKKVYTHLLTNIAWLNPVELFHFYNERQTIEAFFKLCKHTYGIKNLRTTKFDGIHAFLWLVLITHNLLTWMKVLLLHGTGLECAGIRTILNKVGRLKVVVQESSAGAAYILPGLSKMVRILMSAFCGNNPIQLEFPFFT